MEQNKSNAGCAIPDGCAAPLPDEAAACCRTVEATLKEFREQLSAAARDVGSERFNLAQIAGNPGVFTFDARFLAFRLTACEPGKSCANIGFEPVEGVLSIQPQAVSLELFAGSAFGGRVPPPEISTSQGLRFLRLQGRLESGAITWLYRCPPYHVDNNGAGNGESQIELTTEQLATKCFELLVLAPMCPPDSRMVARAFCG